MKPSEFKVTVVLTVSASNGKTSAQVAIAVDRNLAWCGGSGFNLLKTEVLDANKS